MATMDGQGKAALQKQLDHCLAGLTSDPENPHSLERMAYLLVKLDREAEGVATYVEAARHYTRIGLVHRALDLCARILLIEPHHAQAIELQKELEDEDDDQTLTPPSWDGEDGAEDTASDSHAHQAAGGGGMEPMLPLPGGVSPDDELLVSDWDELAAVGGGRQSRTTVEGDSLAVVGDRAVSGDVVEVDDADVVAEGRISSAENAAPVDGPADAGHEAEAAARAAAEELSQSGSWGDELLSSRALPEGDTTPGAAPGSLDEVLAAATEAVEKRGRKRDPSVLELRNKVRQKLSETADVPPVDEIEPPEFFNLLQTVTDLQSTLSVEPINPRVAMPVEDASESSGQVVCDTLPLRLLPDDFAKHAEHRVVEAGACVAREGQKNNRLMVLRRGRAEVTKVVGRGTRRERLVYLGGLEDDSCFGELALLGDGRRHASVKAMERCELLELDKRTVKRWMSESSKLNRAIRSLYRHRLQKWFKRSSSLFAGLDDHKATAFLKRCKPKAIKADTLVLKKGESAPGLFLLLLGLVDVNNPLGDPWGDLLLHRLSDGDFFGEISLLLERPSPADYRTRTFCQLMVITYDDLFVFGLEAPTVLRQLDDESRRRVKGYHAITAGEAQYEDGAMVYLLDKKKDD